MVKQQKKMIAISGCMMKEILKRRLEHLLIVSRGIDDVPLV